MGTLVWGFWIFEKHPLKLRGACGGNRASKREICTKDRSKSEPVITCWKSTLNKHLLFALKQSFFTSCWFSVEIIARFFQFSSLSISNIKISGRVFHLLCECRLRDVHFRVGINVGFPDLTGPLYEDHLQFLWRKQSMRSMVWCVTKMPEAAQAVSTCSKIRGTSDAVSHLMFSSMTFLPLALVSSNVEAHHVPKFRLDFDAQPWETMNLVIESVVVQLPLTHLVHTRANADGVPKKTMYLIFKGCFKLFQRHRIFYRTNTVFTASEVTVGTVRAAHCDEHAKKFSSSWHWQAKNNCEIELL